MGIWCWRRRVRGLHPSDAVGDRVAGAALLGAVGPGAADRVVGGGCSGAGIRCAVGTSRADGYIPFVEMLGAAALYALVWTLFVTKASLFEPERVESVIERDRWR